MKQETVTPEELVRDIKSFLLNPTAWRPPQDMMYGEQEIPQGAIEIFADERARNIVSWLVAEFVIRRRPT